MQPIEYELIVNINPAAQVQYTHAPFELTAMTYNELISKMLLGV